jgi:hypothetical protein
LNPVDAGVDVSDPNDVPEGVVLNEDGRIEGAPEDEISLDVAAGSNDNRDMESGNPWDSDNDSLDLLDEYGEIPIQGMPGTPVEKLAQEDERVMRVTAEDLELGPAVYMHEGSELLSQLRDQLVMLPELHESVRLRKPMSESLGRLTRRWMKNSDGF